MKQRKRTLEDSLYRIGWWFLAAGAMTVGFYFGLVAPRVRMPECVFYHYLHIYCPGCGGTRAVEALLHGKLLLSLWYHPVVLYTVILFGGFMLTQTLERLQIGRVKGWKYHNWHLYGALVIIISNFFIKNLLKIVFDITL